jgi:hypothetical protein
MPGFLEEEDPAMDPLTDGIGDRGEVGRIVGIGGTGDSLQRISGIKIRC